MNRHMVFWEGSLVRRSTHKKDLKRHMVFWEGSLVRRSTHKKDLERHMVFWEGSLVRRSTHKKDLKRHMVLLFFASHVGVVFQEVQAMDFGFWILGQNLDPT